MSDLQSIKEAAAEASANVDREEGSAGELDEVRAKATELLRLHTASDPNAAIVDKVVDSLSKMLWPERSLELKREKKMLGLKRQAIQELVVEELIRMQGVSGG